MFERLLAAGILVGAGLACQQSATSSPSTEGSGPAGTDAVAGFSCEAARTLGTASWPRQLADALCAAWRAKDCGALAQYADCESELRAVLEEAATSAPSYDTDLDVACAQEWLNLAFEAACDTVEATPAQCQRCRLFAGSLERRDLCGGGPSFPVRIDNCAQPLECDYCTFGPDDIRLCCTEQCTTPVACPGRFLYGGILLRP